MFKALRVKEQWICKTLEKEANLTNLNSPVAIVWNSTSLAFELPIRSTIALFANWRFWRPT